MPPNPPSSVSLLAFYESNHSAKLIDKIIKYHQFHNLTEQLAEASMVFSLCGSPSFGAVVGNIVIGGAVTIYYAQFNVGIQLISKIKNDQTIASQFLLF